MKTAASILTALALLCATPVFAQHNGRDPQRCAPGDPRCNPPGKRDEWGPRDGSARRVPPGRPPTFAREPERYDQGRRNDRWNDRPSYHRGDRVPFDYRSRQYVVDDWQGHGLRRPPRGYHWVQNGGDYLLVAITTGIILELLLNQ